MLDLEHIRAKLMAKLKLYTYDWPALDRPPAHLPLKQKEPVKYLLRALAKLGAGTYGVCDTCQEPIDTARLEAVIGACRCLECQELHETQPPS